MVVLGYCWFTCYNPLFDWVLGSIFFWQPSQFESKSSPSVKTLPLSAPLPKLPDSVLDIPNTFLLVTPQKPLRVNFINAAVYSHTRKLEGLDCFQLWISLSEVTGHSVTTSETKVSMVTIPEDYHDFADIFSKYKAGKLADH